VNQHGIIGECTECGGQMIEHSLSHIDGTGHIGLLCEDCGAEGQIEYEMGEEQPWDDPSVCEGVTDMSVAEINWIDCPRCYGGGWVEDPVCDLSAAMNGRDTPCPRCHTSGSVPRIVEDEQDSKQTDTPA